MRLFDFHCRACGKDFEELVRDVADARCPACHSAEVAKQLSAFAVGGTGGGSEAAGPSACGAGSCGTGMCGLG